VDIQTLNANKDRLMEGYGDGSPEHIEKFVRSVRSTKVSDEFVDASYELLPKKFQDSLKGKGTASNNKETKEIHFLKYDEDGNAVRGGASSKDRAKLMWRIYLEQGGRDAYTGLPLDLESMDLEHVRGFNNTDDGQPSKEQWEQRENDKNFTLVSSAVNQKKSDLSMEEFFRTEVDPHKDKTEEDFGGIQKMYDKANEISSVSLNLIKTMSEGDNKDMIPDMTGETLSEYFSQDDGRFTDLRGEFRKAATNDKDKKKAGQLKSKMGKELLKSLGLTRGITDASGRRTNSLAENVYRGFLISMANRSPEERLQMKEHWAEAIKAGNETRDQKAVTSKLVELGAIDEDIINDKKLGKVFREGVEWAGELLTEE